MLPEPGNSPAAQFVAALRRLSTELDAEGTCVPLAWDTAPPPVLCPHPDSPVRFLPLIDKTTLPEAVALRRLDGKRWRFIDLAPFEGDDFAYAVCRSLLHRLPNGREIAAAASMEGRFRLLLAVDFEARRTNAPGRLRGLGSARRLYRVWRAAETLRLHPLALAVRALLDARGRKMFVKKRARIAARRELLASLVRSAGRR
jgi:hypothetical protein